MDLEPRLWRNPKKDSFDAQKAKVMAFGAKWAKFDFTKKSGAKRARDHDSSSDSE